MNDLWREMTLDLYLKTKLGLDGINSDLWESGVINNDLAFKLICELYFNKLCRNHICKSEDLVKNFGDEIIEQASILSQYNLVGMRDGQIFLSEKGYQLAEKIEIKIGESFLSYR